MKIRQNDLLLLAISIFVIVVIWIGTNLYHAFVTSTITETQNIQVTPIDPHFDREVLEKLKSRTVVDPLFEADSITASTHAIPSPSVSIRPSISPTATPSSRVTPLP